MQDQSRRKKSGSALVISCGQPHRDESQDSTPKNWKVRNLDRNNAEPDDRFVSCL